jgi:hypothetical protein
MSGGNEKNGMCGICSAGCGVVVTYDREGRISGVRADKESPFGMICRVGERSPEILSSTAKEWTEGVVRVHEDLLGRGVR